MTGKKQERKQKQVKPKNKNKMRKVEFAVPQEVMSDFVEAMNAHSMENSITGTNDDCEILIEVNYEKDESEIIDELEEYLLKLREELDVEIEEEEDEN